MLEFRVSFSFLNYLTKMPKTKKFESRLTEVCRRCLLLGTLRCLYFDVNKKTEN